MPGEFKAGAITGEVDLNRGPAVETLRAIPKEAATMTKGVEREANQAATSMSRSFKESLHGIKDQFGRRSALGESLEILRGAGPAMAIGIAVEGVKMLAQGAEKVATDFRLGKISSDELGFSLVKQIPIIGSIAEAEESLREVFTGQKAEIEQINQEAKETDAIYASQLAAMKQHIKTMREIGDEIRRNNLEAAKQGADPFTVRRLALAQEAIDTPEKRAEDRDKAIQAEKDKHKGEIDALTARRDAASTTAKEQQDKVDSRRHGRGQLGLGDEIKKAKELQDESEAANKRLMEAIARKNADIAEINKRYAGVGVSDAATLAKKQTQVEIDLVKTKDSALASADDKLRTDRQAAKIAAMEADGREDAAHIQEIQDRLENQKRDNAQKMLDDVKTAGPGADTSFITSRLKLMEDQNAALQSAADSAITRFKNDRAKEITDALSTPLDRYKAEVKKLDQELHDNIITKDQRDDAVAAEQKRTSDSMGLNSIKTPLEKFTEELKNIAAALKAGIISPEKAGRFTGAAQDELRKETDQQWSPSQQSVRRFNFIELHPPEMANPNEKLLGPTEKTAENTSEAVTLLTDIKSAIAESHWSPVPPL